MLMKLTRPDESETFPGPVWVNTDLVQMVFLIKSRDKIVTRIMFSGDDSFDVLETLEYIASFFPENATKPRGS